MPKGRHLKGVSDQEQRQYERILAEAVKPADMAGGPRKWLRALCSSGTIGSVPKRRMTQPCKPHRKSRAPR